MESVRWKPQPSLCPDSRVTGESHSPGSADSVLRNLPIRCEERQVVLNRLANKCTIERVPVQGRKLGQEEYRLFVEHKRSYSVSLALDRDKPVRGAGSGSLPSAFLTAISHAETALK